MDWREQQMQRNEANRPKVIPAIENRTRTPDQVMTEYRACAQHEEHCDAEHRRPSMGLLSASQGRREMSWREMAHGRLRKLAVPLAQLTPDEPSELGELIGVLLGEHVDERRRDRIRP